MSENFETLRQSLPVILDGLLVTVYLTIGGAALAFVLSVVLGLMAGTKHWLPRGIARVIIEFFRGTSLVVQLFFLFFVLPMLGWELDPIACGIVGLGLNYGAYGAEVVRGSIASVPRGQKEATVALSLTRMQAMRRVLFPQAWALMIPSLTNLLIQLLKGTAIVSFITLSDLTYATDKLRVDTNTVFAYSVALILYFLLAYLLTLLMNLLEVRARHRLGRGESLRDALRFGTPKRAVV